MSTEQPWVSGPVTPRATCILAPNPGPMTLDGTNTWILHEPGGSEAIVVDPGPLDEGHLATVVETVATMDAHVSLIILTHGHWDHAEAAGRFADMTGAPVRAVGQGHDDLDDGEVLAAGELEVRVVATPGHTADSVSFALPADQALLTGDTVLGRGTSVVAFPDGELGAYLDSLERIRHLTGDGTVVSILPGHGPVVPDAADMVAFYKRHRHERLDQVRQALADGAATETDPVEGVLRRAYADVPSTVWPAARLSIRAQVDYLNALDA